MADPSPLLKRRQSPTTLAPSIEDTIESCIGPSGLAQLLQAFIISFAWFFDAQQTFITIFADTYPSWRCTYGKHPSCSSPTPCSLPPASSWSWSQPKETSTVSEWNLECAPPALLGLPASAYFSGCLAGGLILATLADSWLGRKKMIVLSCLTMSVSASLAAASPNIFVYAALRFVCGFGRATVATSALVLSTEIVGRRWRDRVSNFGYLCFTLGFLSLPGMAYLGRGSSWRNLYVWTSVPSLCYAILIHFLIRESPRWLLTRGRRDEAVEALKCMAKSNGAAIDFAISDVVAFVGVGDEGSDHDQLKNVDVCYSALRILWQKKWAFRRLAAVMTVSFGLGVVYYGMPINVGNLSSNIYASVAVNAVSELPSCLASFLLIGKLNRRASTLALTTASAAGSVSCAFLRAGGLRMAAEVVSFSSACAALNVFTIYTVELFPTCVRNSGVSMLRQALVAGGVVAPAVAAERRRAVSFGVFGLLVGCCGLFTVCLPETRGRGMSDTMEEEEDKIDARRVS